MRRKDREVTEIIDILKIVEKTKILHLALFDEEYPYVVTLHYGYEYINKTVVFFMHSAKEGHKLDLIRSNPNVCIALECDLGIVSGEDIPCKYGAAYSSVIVKGKAELVKQPAEKIKGLKRIMKNQINREFEIDEKMASMVEVIKVTAYELTAKSCPMQLKSSTSHTTNRTDKESYFQALKMWV